jgi:hypothetical protein
MVDFPLGDLAQVGPEKIANAFQHAPNLLLAVVSEFAVVSVISDRIPEVNFLPDEVGINRSVGELGVQGRDVIGLRFNWDIVSLCDSS